MSATPVQHVIIDGNNLLYAMHEQAPGPPMGRETLVRVLERWASERRHRVTVAFDGPTPPANLSKQMNSPRIEVVFSGAETADEVIIRMVQEARHPDLIRVVTSDHEIRHEARYRRCACTRSNDFVAEVFAPPVASAGQAPAEETHVAPDKPSPPADIERWLESFGVAGEEEPFDGYDAMRCD